MKEMFIIMITTLLLMACCEQQPPIPDPPDNPKDTIFELIWESRLDPGKSIVGSDYVQMWDSCFLCTGDNVEPPTLKAFNKLTGKKEWEYIHHNGLKYNIYYNKLINDVYIGITGDGIFGFDLKEKKVIWEVNEKYFNFEGGWNMTVRGEYIYQPVTWEFKHLGVAVERIIRIHYLTGKWEDVYAVKSSDSLMNAFSAPVFWHNPDTGHDIMYFNNQNWNMDLSPQEITQDMIAVDVETKKVVWKNASFSPVASNGSIHPAVYKDNIITGGDWSMYSFDARTGKQNWKREFTELKPFWIWNTTNHLVKENRIYVNDVGPNIWCLNADTGDVIWNNTTDAPNCTPTMTYYEDMLVYTSWGKGSIMVLDAFTGKKIHQEQSHNYSTFNTDVVYDPATDMFFTTDYLYAYGFKIRKPK